MIIFLLFRAGLIYLIFVAYDDHYLCTFWDISLIINSNGGRQELEAGASTKFQQVGEEAVPNQLGEEEGSQAQQILRLQRIQKRDQDQQKLKQGKAGK